MDDFDLYTALSSKEKTALGVQEALKHLRLDTKERRIGAAAGAAALTAASYLTSKRFGKKPSLFETTTGAMDRAAQSSERANKKEGKKTGYMGKMTGLGAKTLKELARIQAEHPVLSALPAAAIGKDVGTNAVDFVMSRIAKIKGVKKP